MAVAIFFIPRLGKKVDVEVDNIIGFNLNFFKKNKEEAKKLIYKIKDGKPYAGSKGKVLLVAGKYYYILYYTLFNLFYSLIYINIIYKYKI